MRCRQVDAGRAGLPHPRTGLDRALLASARCPNAREGIGGAVVYTTRARAADADRMGHFCVRRGSREYEEILNFINEQITPHLRLALRAVGTLRHAPRLFAALCEHACLVVS